MSAGPEAVSRLEHDRYPLRTRMDGDFDLPRLLLASPLTRRGKDAWCATPVAGIAEAAVSAALWQLAASERHGSGSAIPALHAGIVPARHDRPSVWRASPAEVRLLHSFETCPALRPPVAESCDALTDGQARAWLSVAAHWIGVSSAIRDLRFFNAACKLLGAVHASRASESRSVSSEVSLVAQLAATATSELCGRLASQFRTACGPEVSASDWLPARQPAATFAARPPQIVLLAGLGSDTAGRLAIMAGAVGVRLAALCWFAPPPHDQQASSYDDAWYPAAYPPQVTSPALAVPIAQARADSWDRVSDILLEHDADLVILAGMPIVPAGVLGLARLGVVNAHNGALPGYRGMDAVAWAILGNDPIVCTLHLAEPGPDRGPVLGSAAVPFAPAGTLRARVKATQLSLLITAAAHVSTVSSLPAATPQPAGQGRQFYRLHPHLKRILDCSPYGAASASPAGGCPQ